MIFSSLTLNTSFWLPELYYSALCIILKKGKKEKEKENYIPDLKVKVFSLEIY